MLMFKVRNSESKSPTDTSSVSPVTRNVQAFTRVLIYHAQEILQIHIANELHA